MAGCGHPGLTSTDAWLIIDSSIISVDDWSSCEGKGLWRGGERTPTDVWFRQKDVSIWQEEVGFVIVSSLKYTIILHTSWPNIPC